jgi:hypothetical protein
VSRCGVGNVCFLSHVSVSFPALVCLVVWVRVCQLWFVLTFGGFWAFWCSPVCSSVGARVCVLCCTGGCAGSDDGHSDSNWKV